MPRRFLELSPSRRSWLLTCAVSLVLLGGALQSASGQGSINHNGFVFEFTTPGATTIGPVGNFTNGTTDHMHQVWWWQQGAGAAAAASQVALAYPPTTQSYAANVATLTWVEPGWTHELVITLTADAATNSAQVIHEMTVTNSSAASTSIRLYCYSDFDVNGAGTDSADLVGNNPSHMRISDGALYSDFMGIGSSNYQVTTYPTLRDSLNSGALVTLNNSGLPFPAADFTGAFQWNRTVASGASTTVVAIQTYNLVASPVVPPSQISCINHGSGMEMSWVNSAAYDNLTILRDGTTIATLLGTDTTFTESIGAGTYDYEIVGTIATASSTPTGCQLSVGFTHTLKINDLDAFAGQSHLSVPITADSITNVMGCSAAVQYPTDRLTATSVDFTGSAPLAGGADFVDSQIGADFVTVDIVMDTMLPVTPPMAAGTDMLLGTMVFTVNATVVDGETRVLDFVDGLGGIDNEFLTLNGPVTPFLFAATVTFYDSATFTRGDCNLDSSLSLPDAIFLLNYLFSFGAPPPCFSACDADDNGAVQLPDAIVLLNYLFSQGAAPPAPFPLAGPDPTPDTLTCL